MQAGFPSLCDHDLERLWNIVWEPPTEFKAKGNTLSSSWKRELPPLPRGSGQWGFRCPGTVPLPLAHPWPGPRLTQHLSCSELPLKFLREPLP